MKNKENKIEQIIKIGGFLVLLTGSIIGVLQFIDSQKKTDPIAEDRKKIYMELSDIVGKIISTNNDSLFNLYSNKFYEFYNGKMIFVEDTSVSLAMKKFKFELDDKLNGYQNINKNKFQIIGMNLIKTCKQEIKY